MIKAKKLFANNSRYIKSGASLLAGDAYQHGLRLVSNLIMTRLLYPEAFGLMLIVNTFMTGLELFSDVGIRDSVILKSKESGNEENYLHVAWTMKVIRGITLCLFSLMLAYPLALFYENPQLFSLIFITSLTPLIRGLGSPKMMAAERDVKIGVLVFIRMLSQTVATVAVVAWLLVVPSIYALAFHGVFQVIILSFLSYRMLEEWHPKFSWNHEIVVDMFHFGKWVFLSTIMAFLANNSDKLLLGKIMKAELLGIYSIAVNFAALAHNLILSLGHKLLFPVYAELKKSGDKSKIDKIRSVFAFAALPAAIFLSLFGNWLIDILYDDRYSQAGWMLQVLASSSIFVALSATLTPMLPASGNSKHMLLVQTARFVLLVLSMLLGYQVGGLLGVIVGIALAPVFVYPISLYFGIVNGVRNYTFDIVVIVMHVMVVLFGWYFTGFLASLSDVALV